MRDIAIVSMVAVILPFVFRYPHVGLLGFTWISLMNPHRLTFGFAYSLPYALLFMALTGAVWLFSKERKLPPMVMTTWLLLAFMTWLSVTTYLSWLPEPAFHKFDRSIKIILGAILTMVLIDRKERVLQLVWVMCLSIGFYGIKGGLFTIVTGGDNRVWGPPDSFLADNNALALSLVMVGPLMFFLWQETQNRWVKLAIVGTFVMTLGSVVGTYSRGGLLALGGMAGFLWYRTRKKTITIILAGLVGLTTIAYLPSSWQQRMSSIQEFQEDDSFQARIRAWSFALEVVEDSPVTGGGFQVFRLNRTFQNGEETFLNAHSIYFEVLGEHGYVGLVLFLMMGISSFLSCSYVLARARIYSELEWAGHLASMIQVTLVGYAIGGAALNLAFFDLLYFVLALSVIVTGIVREHQKAQVGTRQWVVHSAWNSNAPASRPPWMIRGAKSA